jgi:signal recognition particle subunit SRP54
MFDNLTRRVSTALSQIGGKKTLSEDNIAETLREVRLALLEADVALQVVQDFLGRVRQRAVGSEVGTSLSPAQSFLRIGCRFRRCIRWP